jgi:hypothetical protein
MCGLEVEGPVQSNHCEGTEGGRVRLSGISLCLKRLMSRQIAGLHTLKAASDGAFVATCVTACALTMAQSAPLSGPVRCVLTERSWVLLDLIGVPPQAFATVSHNLPHNLAHNLAPEVP